MKILTTFNLNSLEGNKRFYKRFIQNLAKQNEINQISADDLIDYYDRTLIKMSKKDKSKIDDLDKNEIITLPQVDLILHDQEAFNNTFFVNPDIRVYKDLCQHPLYIVDWEKRNSNQIYSVTEMKKWGLDSSSQSLLEKALFDVISLGKLNVKSISSMSTPFVITNRYGLNIMMEHAGIVTPQVYEQKEIMHEDVGFPLIARDRCGHEKAKPVYLKTLSDLMKLDEQNTGRDYVYQTVFDEMPRANNIISIETEVLLGKKVGTYVKSTNKTNLSETKVKPFSISSLNKGLQTRIENLTEWFKNKANEEGVSHFMWEGVLYHGKIIPIDCKTPTVKDYITNLFGTKHLPTSEKFHQKVGDHLSLAYNMG